MRPIEPHFMVKHVVLCCLVLTLAPGCSKTPEPPQQLPRTFYGTFGDVHDEASLTLRFEQVGANLKGTYRLDRPGKKLDSDFTGTTAGTDVHLTLTVPEDIQRSLAWSDKLELELNLGEISVAELSQKFAAAGETMPKKLRERGSVPQLGGWANFQENGQDKKKLIVLYNLVADEPKS